MLDRSSPCHLLNLQHLLHFIFNATLFWAHSMLAKMWDNILKPFPSLKIVLTHFCLHPHDMVENGHSVSIFLIPSISASSWMKGVELTLQWWVVCRTSFIIASLRNATHSSVSPGISKVPLSMMLGWAFLQTVLRRLYCSVMSSRMYAFDYCIAHPSCSEVSLISVRRLSTTAWFQRDFTLYRRLNSRCSRSRPGPSSYWYSWTSSGGADWTVMKSISLSKLSFFLKTRRTSCCHLMSVLHAKNVLQWHYQVEVMF